MSVELHILTEEEIKRIEKAKRLLEATKYLTKYKEALHLLSVGKSNSEVGRLIFRVM